jgi:hypothetical protein
MALTTCRECKSEVSSNAKVCPRCGIDKPAKTVRTAQQRGQIWLAVIVVVVLYFVGRAFMPDGSSSAPSSSTTAAPAPPLQPLPDDPAHPRPYFVRYEEKAVPKDRIAATIKLVYAKAPAPATSYADLLREMTRYVTDNKNPKVGDIGGYVYVGDRTKPETWEQVKDPQHGYIWAWYDWSKKSIMKGMRDPPVVLAQVNAGIAGPAQPTAAERQAERVKATIFGIRMLKSQMRNPSSFELISAAISDSGERCIEYRAQNGFGGMNVEQAVFGSEFKTSATAGFAADWNSKCASQPLTDVTDRVKLLLGQ